MPSGLYDGTTHRSTPWIGAPVAQRCRGSGDGPARCRASPRSARPCVRRRGWPRCQARIARPLHRVADHPGAEDRRPGGSRAAGRRSWPCGDGVRRRGRQAGREGDGGGQRQRGSDAREVARRVLSDDGGQVGPGEDHDADQHADVREHREAGAVATRCPGGRRRRACRRRAASAPGSAARAAVTTHQKRQRDDADPSSRRRESSGATRNASHSDERERRRRRCGRRAAGARPGERPRRRVVARARRSRVRTTTTAARRGQDRRR